jgi:hypothetical protein
MELNKMQRRERERRKKKLKMDEIKLDAEVHARADRYRGGTFKIFFKMVSVQQ